MRTFLALGPLFLVACGPQSLGVVMNAENNSGQSGSATITALSTTKVRVVVDIAAAESTAEIQAHIHPGTCGEIGPIKYTLANLKFDAATKRFSSSTDLPVTLAELSATPYAINAHHHDDFSLYVACGEIHK